MFILYCVGSYVTKDLIIHSICSTNSESLGLCISHMARNSKLEFRTMDKIIKASNSESVEILHSYLNRIQDDGPNDPELVGLVI